MLLTASYIQAFDFAVEILRKGRIKFFPVNPIILANNLHIPVITYKEFAKKNETSVSEYLKVSTDGFCIYLGDQPAVLYNSEVESKGRRRWTLIHEISHIMLHHIDEKHPTLKKHRADKRRWLESEADELTLCLIAPLPIAHMCGVESRQEIRRLFGLSKEASENIYADFEKALKGRKLTYLKFNDFVSEYTPFVSEWIWRKREYRNRTPGLIYRHGVPNLDIYADDT